MGCTEASRGHGEERGTGTKAAVSLGSSQKKKRISQRDLYGAGAPLYSPQEEWPLLGTWQSETRCGGGAEIHTGLLCPGRARNKAGCCQPPHGRRPWREVGLPSSLDTRQVSNKQALSAARVWHSSVRSTHNPTSAEPPAARPAHQSTRANAVPPD